MSRISKKSVHAALEQAAKNILNAAGDDPFVSRAERSRRFAVNRRPGSLEGRAE